MKSMRFAILDFENIAKTRMTALRTRLILKKTHYWIH